MSVGNTDLLSPNFQTIPGWSVSQMITLDHYICIIGVLKHHIWQQPHSHITRVVTKVHWVVICFFFLRVLNDLIYKSNKINISFWFHVRHIWNIGNGWFLAIFCPSQISHFPCGAPGQEGGAHMAPRLRGASPSQCLSNLLGPLPIYSYSIFLSHALKLAHKHRGASPYI